MLGGLVLEEVSISQRVSALVRREVAGVDGAAARRSPRVSFHERAAGVEAHERAVDASAQLLADEARRQRVERLLDLGEMIAADLRLVPARDVVALRWRREQPRLLLGLEALERQALRARVTTQPVLLPAPALGVLARRLDRPQPLAGEAVVADGLYGTLDAALIARFSTRAGSTTKPRDWAYSRNVALSSRSSGSAFWTIAFVLSGSSTAKTPPKNVHAASHASIASAVVSRSHGHTKR